MQETTQKNTVWNKIFTRDNLQMLLIFVVIVAITAVFANQTNLHTVRLDTAENVPGNVEDIADAVFENLEVLEATGNSIASEIEADSSTDDIVSTIIGLLEDESLESIETINVALDEGTVLTLDLSTAETVDDISSDESTVVTMPDTSTAWALTDTDIVYTPDDSAVDLWLTLSQESMATILADSALREDLFETTESGYILVATGDNQVVAQYNRESTSTEDIADLSNDLNAIELPENVEYYDLETDPIIQESSFIARQSSDVNDWVVIGSYPTSEVPSPNVFDSTFALFDVTEVGNTISLVVERAVEFLNEDIGWLFRSLRWPIEQAINLIEGALLATHWSIILAGTAIIAMLSGGRRVVYIATISMFLIGLLGLWDLTITTLAMLITSMAFCVVVGIPLGIWSASNDTVNDVVRAVLDAMQTIHPFVYLVPIVVLFGIGKVPGTIATIIFALPPMVRLTNLGIRQVPEDVVEAGKAFGSSDWQLLRNVQIPLALPSIMAGVNQTLMLSLSMVVIVALIAGGGLGQEIFRAIGRADTGRAVVAGVAVLLLAVAVDRISQGQSVSKNKME